MKSKRLSIFALGMVSLTTILAGCLFIDQFSFGNYYLLSGNNEMRTNAAPGLLAVSRDSTRVATGMSIEYRPANGAIQRYWAMQVLSVDATDSATPTAGVTQYRSDLNTPTIEQPMAFSNSLEASDIFYSVTRAGIVSKWTPNYGTGRLNPTTLSTVRASDAKCTNCANPRDLNACGLVVTNSGAVFVMASVTVDVSGLPVLMQTLFRGTKTGNTWTWQSTPAALTATCPALTYNSNSNELVWQITPNTLIRTNTNWPVQQVGQVAIQDAVVRDIASYGPMLAVAADTSVALYDVNGNLHDRIQGEALSVADQIGAGGSVSGGLFVGGRTDNTNQAKIFTHYGLE